MNFALFIAAALSLNGAWKLDYRFEEERGDWKTIETQVPGDAYVALQDAGVIPDLTIGTNVWGVFRYEQCEWRYSRSFDAPELRSGERAELVFDGVDTRATYTLNGKVIGRSANMFIPHRFDVTDMLKPKGNTIEVLIASPLGRSLLNVLGRSRVGGTDVEGIRKAQHSFGWDIMPRVVCGGIWRDVRVEVLPPERFGDVFWIVERVDAEKKTADVRVQCQVLAPRKRLHASMLKVSLALNGKVVATDEHPLRYAQTSDSLKVKDAELWWPRSAGAPVLYDAIAELFDMDGKLLARDVRKIGLRTVRLERADWYSEENPGTFRFIVNGAPVYMHGCDWTPMDALHSRDGRHLQKCLDMLVDLNCNMIRIWGGGVYEPDALYDFCDRNGILVWQDFMMGNVEPEQNDDFAKAIEDEARVQVVRLRSHPCLALWCANNEQDRSVASDWGENAPDPAGDRISREVLPRVLRDFDPFTPYIPSSPWWTPDVVSGKAKLSQDHLWGPRSQYFKGPFWTANTPTFVSETGYHGCPNVESLKRMMTPGCVCPWPCVTNKFIFNDEWRCKATVAYPEQGPSVHGDNRNALMPKQSEIMFGKCPEKLEDFASASQHAQAEALKTWIELSRSKKGRMWGLLWWNLRDGWPIVSDGVVDYYFGKKQAYDAIKISSQDELVMIRDDHSLVAVNDRFRNVRGYVKVFDRESGRVVFEDRYTVKANSTAVLGTIEWVGQGVFEIEYTVDEEWHRNYYLYGNPPFDFARFDPLLKEVRKGNPVYDEAMRYRNTGRRKALDNAIAAADKVVVDSAPSARTIRGLCELVQVLPPSAAAKYRAYAEKAVKIASEAVRGDLFFRQSVAVLKDLKRRESELSAVAEGFPESAGLPDDEYRYRFRIFDEGRFKVKDLSVAKTVVNDPIPHASEELYWDFVKNGNRSRYESRWFDAMKNFEVLVAAEVKEGKGRYIPRIEDYLRTFCGWKTWVFPAHDGQIRGRNGNLLGIAQSVDLFSSELAAVIACCMDRLADRIDAALVSRVKSEVEFRIFTPIRRDIRFMKSQGGDPKDMSYCIYQWWIDSLNNWNAVCWDNVLCAAFEFIDDPVDRAKFIDGAMKSVDTYLSGFTPDGYCSEGMGYWNYGYGHHMLMGYLLRRMSGGKVDILTRPIQRRIAEYARNYELRPGLSPAFADGNGSPTAQNIRLAEMLWPGSDSKPAQVSVFPDGQVWLFRADKGISVAFKGGHNGEHHNHNDIGSYYVVKNGAFISGDAGREEYTARTFSSRRYTSPILNSYGHPVPLVAGKKQKTGAQYCAKVLSQDFGKEKCTVSIEIKGAYDIKSLKSLVRTFTWERSGASLTVKDVFEFSEPMAFEVPYLVYDGRDCEPEISVAPAGYTLKKEKVPNPRAPWEPWRVAIVPAKPVVRAEVAVTFR